ncbi:MAG: hypothetical protein ABI882_15160 [Acidobacteriota bacterium]
MDQLFADPAWCRLVGALLVSLSAKSGDDIDWFIKIALGQSPLRIFTFSHSPQFCLSRVRWKDFKYAELH